MFLGPYHSIHPTFASRFLMPHAAPGVVPHLDLQERASHSHLPNSPESMMSMVGPLIDGSGGENNESIVNC